MYLAIVALSEHHFKIKVNIQNGRIKVSKLN